MNLADALRAAPTRKRAVAPPPPRQSAAPAEKEISGVIEFDREYGRVCCIYVKVNGKTRTLEVERDASDNIRALHIVKESK